MKKYDFIISYSGGGVRFFTTYADALAEALNSATAFAELNRSKYKGFPNWIIEQAGGANNEAGKR